MNGQDVVLKLKELVEEEGYNLRSYSGRGMYGATCVGVTVGSTANFLMKVAARLGEEGLEALGEACTDNMGLDYIVYWPDTPWDGAYSDGADEWDDDDED